MENENKICENCRFAQQHYIINHSGYFIKLHGAMDCRHNKITKKQFKKNYKENCACPYWEPFELQQQKYDQNIEDMLRFISKRLDKIIQVLESKAIEKSE